MLSACPLVDEPPATPATFTSALVLTCWAGGLYAGVVCFGTDGLGKHTVNTTRRVKRTQVAANIGDALTTVTSMKRSKKIRGLVF